MRQFGRIDRELDDGLLDALLKPPTAPSLVLDADRVVLHGAGAMGRLACSVLAHLGIRVDCMMDRAAKPGQTIPPNLEVVRPDDPILATKRAETIVLVTTVSAPFEAVRDELHAIGWQNVHPFYDYANQFVDRHPLNNGWFAPARTDGDRLAISRILGALADDVSRAHYIQFLAWRLLREDWIFQNAPIVAETRFFIPEIRSFLEARDLCFVDAGAYDGRVLQQLLAITEGHIEQALLFEPDPDNRALLHTYLDTVPADMRERTKVYPFALGNRTGRQPFAAGYGLMSRICREGETEIASASVDVVCLDDLDLTVSFAKFHLEGAEYDALEGAKATIRRQRPVIAATVYHNADGLFRTLTHLLDQAADYALYFRLHSWCGTGATVYGIPKT
ncbi:MAG: FkbM family methyltransferase [Pseudomonadota bacterium]